MPSFRDFVADLSHKVGLTVPQRWEGMDEIALAQRFLEKLNSFFYQTYDGIGTTTYDGEEFQYFSEFHRFWEAHHREILNVRINRGQAALVAKGLHESV